MTNFIPWSQRSQSIPPAAFKSRYFQANSGFSQKASWYYHWSRQLLVSPLFGIPFPNRSRSRTAEKTQACIPLRMKGTMLVENVMKPSPITITDYSHPMDATLIMKGNKIDGLPVVDSNDELVEVITFTDIVIAISEL